MIMRELDRTTWLKSLIVGVMCVSVLAACGGPRSTSGSAAIAAPQATVVPQNVKPVATPVSAQPTSAPAMAPTTSLATAESPTVTPVPTSTAAPAATATSTGPAKSSQSGAALEQLLQQLSNANDSADQLNDVPQLK
jgi:hypothetical protein